MHLIVHTMQGQTQDSKELENSPSGRVSQCIEPRSIQLSQACCASHSGRLSSHRRHSRQQRAPISIVDHGCWHFATLNVDIYLKAFARVFISSSSRHPFASASTAAANLQHVLSNRTHECRDLSRVPHISGFPEKKRIKKALEE